MKKEPWYNKKSTVIILIFLCFPVGLAAAWLSDKFSKRERVIWSVLILVSVLAYLPTATKNKNYPPKPAVQQQQNEPAKNIAAKNTISKKNTKIEVARDRKKEIEEQFNPWDGSHINLTRQIKASMHDPGSYDHVETVYWDQKKYIVVQTTFRGKNALGATILNRVKAKVSNKGTVLQILK